MTCLFGPLERPPFRGSAPRKTPLLSCGSTSMESPTLRLTSQLPRPCTAGMTALGRCQQSPTGICFCWLSVVSPILNDSRWGPMLTSLIPASPTRRTYIQRTRTQIHQSVSHCNVSAALPHTRRLSTETLHCRCRWQLEVQVRLGPCVAR